MTVLALAAGAAALLLAGWVAGGRRQTAFLTASAALMCAAMCFGRLWPLAAWCGFLAAAGAVLFAWETRGRRP